MGKYLSWILHKRELAPLSNIITSDANGNIRRIIYNTYECPYCHKTYKCTISNEFDVRKCRWCNHPVSPYKGDTTYEIWLPKGVDEVP